jgi:hypothetical protein
MPPGRESDPMQAGGTPPDRDTEVVRRGLRAGLLTAVVVGGVLVGGALLAGGGGRTGFVAVVAGFAAGAVALTVWLLLAGVLDLLADHRPGRRRLVWTLGAVLATILSPLLLIAAAGA